MVTNIFQWRSLKTRVTLVALAIFIGGIWSLAFYASRMLREDMQRLLGEQQFASATFIAKDLNQEMDDRLRALKSISSHLPAGLLGNPGALQKFLEDRTQVVARDLQVGMVLSRDLLTPNGLLMLSAGHTLDERLIHKIMDFEKSGCLQLTAYIRLDRRT